MRNHVCYYYVGKLDFNEIIWIENEISINSNAKMVMCKKIFPTFEQI